MFTGSIPALVTPFRDGKIDEKALRDLVDWQIEEGSSALVAVGTTGESPTLSHAEHRAAVGMVIDAAAGRVPVIAGAGSNNTAESIGLIQFAAEAGAAAALVVTPYYNKPSQRGLIAHYTALHEAADLPIIIYNIPGRSVIDMTPATMATLAKLPRIIGVKDATADLARPSAQRAACGTDFVQLSGEDATAIQFNAGGGVGCISVTANVAPRLCAQMQAACLANDYARALEINDRLWPLHRALFIEPNPTGAKWCLARMGRMDGELRSPLVPAAPETEAALEAAMEHAGII